MEKITLTINEASEYTGIGRTNFATTDYMEQNSHH
mgnify:CR=1 FL=1